MLSIIIRIYVKFLLPGSSTAVAFNRHAPSDVQPSEFGVVDRDHVFPTPWVILTTVVLPMLTHAMSPGIPSLSLASTVRDIVRLLFVIFLLGVRLYIRGGLSSRVMNIIAVLLRLPLESLARILKVVFEFITSELVSNVR